MSRRAMPPFGPLRARGDERPSADGALLPTRGPDRVHFVHESTDGGRPVTQREIGEPHRPGRGGAASKAQLDERRRPSVQPLRRARGQRPCRAVAMEICHRRDRVLDRSQSQQRQAPSALHLILVGDGGRSHRVRTVIASGLAASATAAGVSRGGRFDEGVRKGVQDGQVSVPDETEDLVGQVPKSVAAYVELLEPAETTDGGRKRSELVIAETQNR